jgi:hypothetical protein
MTDQNRFGLLGYHLESPRFSRDVATRAHYSQRQCIFETIRNAKVRLYDSTDLIVMSSCGTEEVGQRCLSLWYSRSNQHSLLGYYLLIHRL